MTITDSGGGKKYAITLDAEERAALKVLCARLRKPGDPPVEPLSAFSGIVLEGWHTKTAWAREQTDVARHKAFERAPKMVQDQAKAAAVQATDAVIGFDPEA